MRSAIESRLGVLCFGYLNLFTSGGAVHAWAMACMPTSPPCYGGGGFGRGGFGPKARFVSRWGRLVRDRACWRFSSWIPSSL
jgi:hypothetical protein